MIDGLVLSPPVKDSSDNPFSIRTADTGPVRPFPLRFRGFYCRSRVFAVMPRSPGNTRYFECFSLGSCDGDERVDEFVFGGNESGVSVSSGVSGSCSFSLCKSPIAFPNASFVPSNISIRARSWATSCSWSEISKARARSKALNESFFFITTCSRGTRPRSRSPPKKDRRHR